MTSSPPLYNFHFPCHTRTTFIQQNSDILISTLAWVGHGTLAKPYVMGFLFQTYGGLSAGELQLIRQTLLIFFQDMHIRVRAQHN